MFRIVNKTAILFFVGAAVYVFVEILFRGYTHWTMAILGGALFLLIGGLNEFVPWEMPLATQCVIGAGIVTVAEFIAGIILNVWLGLGIWDYSDMRWNILGQICPQFSFAWLGLSLVAIVLDDWLRYWLFCEEKPHYTIFVWRG